MNLVPKRKIGDGQQASVLGNMSIGGYQIPDASITNAKIANLAVGTAEIADLAVENAKIGLLAVDTAQIADAAIENAKIANLAVTNAKINDLDATKITAGYISVDRLEVGTITGAKLEDGTIADVKISTCSIGKLTAGSLNVAGTIVSGGKFVTGAAGTNRIEITNSIIAGYNSANALQFYLQASDGKAYAGAGKVILDSGGVTIKGQFLVFKTDGGVYTGRLWGYTGGIMILDGDDQVQIRTGGGAKIVSLRSTGEFRPGASSTLGSASYPWASAHIDIIDATAGDYIDLPVRSSFPTATPGRVFIYTNGWFYGYSVGAWRRLDYLG